jgi:hypothetical protein
VSRRWSTLALAPLLATACGHADKSRPSAPTVPFIGNSADTDGPRRTADGEATLDGEWLDEVGSQFWFEVGERGEVILARAYRTSGAELTELTTGVDAAGDFWLSYRVDDSDTIVTITLHAWDDVLGGYQCTWDNGDDHGDGTLRPRARVDEDEPEHDDVLDIDP